MGQEGSPDPILVPSPNSIQTHLGNKDYSDPILSIKLSVTLALLLTLAVFWRLTGHYWAMMLLFAAMFLNSIVDGYLDIYYAPLLLGAFAAFRKERYVWFSVLFALACMFKWPPLILGPFFGIHIVRRVWEQTGDSGARWRRLLNIAAPGLAVVAVVVLIFGSEPIFHALYLTLVSKHRIFSGNAMNMPWILSHLMEALGNAPYGPLVEGEGAVEFLPKSGLLTLLIRVPFYVAFAALIWRTWRTKPGFQSTMIYAMAGYVTYFMLNTGVHENHLFIAVLMAVYLFSLSLVPVEVAIWLVLVLNVNLYLFYGGDGSTLHLAGHLKLPRTFFGHVDTALIGSIANCLIFAAWLWPLLRGSAATAVVPERRLQTLDVPSDDEEGDEEPQGVIG
jgi:hypothetical protein